MSKTRSGATYHGLEIRLASSVDELIMCMNLRAAAFLGREGEPYHEEYDGNDLSSAAHLLALDDGVPVGTMRIRILDAADGGVATWQRFASIPTGRLAMKVLLALAEAARDYTIYKGVELVVGEVADPRLLRFWERFGFYRVNADPVYYNGSAYHPIEARFSRNSLPAADPGAHEAEAFYSWRFAGRPSAASSAEREMEVA